MNTLIKVLLVEDEQTLAEIIKETLDSNGFEVTLEFNGEDALHAILNGLDADVIVSDIMMPKMDGFTFMKELDRHGIKIPVLFLTARSDTKDVVKGFEQTELPYRECEVLAYLARHINETASTSDMLTQIWGDDSYFNSRSLNVYITKLRHKLQKDKNVSILNIRSVGYRLVIR